MPGAEEFRSTGRGERNRVAVLVVHGITSTPQSMGPLSEHLAALGYAVRAPLLPGHGRSVQDMIPTRYDDWAGAVHEAAQELRAGHDTVVAVGLSLGGALVTDLAGRHPELVDALVLINPGFAADDLRLRLLPLLQYAFPTFPGLADQIRRPGPPRELAYDRLPLRPFASFVAQWPRLIADFAAVTQPVLLLRSAQDSLVSARSGRLFLDGVGSRDVTEVWLPNSGHVATLDYDQDIVLAETASFVVRVAGLAA